MTWTTHPLDRGLGQHTKAWDALNAKHFGSHPLLGGLFVGGLLQHFGNGHEVLCVRERDGTPDAMCILRRERRGLWRSFLPSQAQIGATLMRDMDDAASLLRALPDTAQRLDVLCVDPLVTRTDHSRSKLSECTPAALTMAVDLRNGYDSWLSGRSKNLRKTLKRYGKDAAEAGLVPRINVLSSPEEVEAGVKRYAALESAGWKGQAGTAINEATGQLPFYGALLSSHAMRGEGWVYELWLGDTLVASRLLIGDGDSVVILKTAFNEQYRDHAPGRWLLHEVIRDAFRRWPTRSLEFYTNASVDQLAWASSQRPIVHLSFYRHDAARHLFHLWRRGAALTAQLRGQSVTESKAQVDVYTAASACPTDVRALFSRSASDRIGQRFEWYENFVATVCHGRVVEFAVLRQDGEPRAVVPLMASQVDATQHEALGNYYTTLYAPALESGSTPACLAPVLRHLRDRPGNLASLRFAPMDPCGPGFTVLRASLIAAGFATFEFFCHGNWYLPVEQGWEHYLASRDGRLRSTITRMQRRLQQADARIEIISGPADVERGITAFEQVYAHSWKRPEPYPGFVPGLIRLCAANGWLRLGLVSIGDKPVAAQLWIVANGRAEIYKLAHDEAYKAFAPGTVLTAHLMRHVLDVDRVREVDYLIGDESYKAQWMSRRRERWGLVAYNLRSASGLAGWLKELAARSTVPLRRLWRPATAPSAMGPPRSLQAPSPPTEEAP